MFHCPRGFTLVEILIVVLLLSIVAMIVIPQFTVASDDARHSALDTDLSTVRRAIELYKFEHQGLSPHLNENGAAASDDFVRRMTGKTDSSGKINAAGERGPYLVDWPANPFATAAAAKSVTCGVDASPRDDSSGWYYCTDTGIMHANTSVGGANVAAE